MHFIGLPTGQHKRHLSRSVLNNILHNLRSLPSFNMQVSDPQPSQLNVSVLTVEIGTRCSLLETARTKETHVGRVTMTNVINQLKLNFRCPTAPSSELSGYVQHAKR